MKLAPAGLAAALLLAFAPGCVIISSKGHTSHSGQYVSAETFEQVQPGRSKAYVQSLFGDPTTKTTLEDGSEVWKWRYTETRTSSGGLILLLSASSTKDRQHNTFVEFRDGVVVKAWRD